MKELKGIDENTVIHCTTKEIEYKVLEILGSHGIKWNSGDIATNYSGHGLSDNCLRVMNERIMYESSDGVKVITAADFIAMNTDPEAEKVEEREIIGYKFKKETTQEIKHAASCIAHGWRSDWQKFKCGSNFLVGSETYEKLLKSGILELWFEPVYREVEKPAFKVGDAVKYITDHNWGGVTMLGEVGMVTGGGHTSEGVPFLYIEWLSCRLGGKSDGIQFESEDFEMATPEEIEAARPKRRYMKQVWRIYYFGIEMEDIYYTEKEANDWLIKNAESGIQYSVRPFLTLAFE